MATLKISDLSVGDWVGYNGKSYRAVIIDALDQTATIFGNDEQGDIRIDQLAPIPITAEILEANGFEFDKASRWHICELEDKTRINVWIGRNNEGRIEVSKPALFDDMYNFKYADIEVSNIAVHQLQHALRLAGVDKEINL